MSPIQMISIATSLIPFLEHDDANRALMGSNMQRQAVPIMLPERPIVGTGLEARAAGDSGYVVQSKMGGCVSYASGKKIVILEKSNVYPRVRSAFTISNKFTSKALEIKRGVCEADVVSLIEDFKSIGNLLLKSPIRDATSEDLAREKKSLRSFYPKRIQASQTSLFFSEAFGKQAYSNLRKKGHNGHYQEKHTAYPFGAAFKNYAFVKQRGNSKQSPLIKPLLQLTKILPVFASQKYQGFMTKFLSEFLVMSLPSRRATPMLLESKIRDTTSKGFVKEKRSMRSFYPKRSKGIKAAHTSLFLYEAFAAHRIKAAQTAYPLSFPLSADMLYGFYVVEPTHPNKHLTKTYNKKNIVDSMRSKRVKAAHTASLWSAALYSSKVYKPVFRYKNVKANYSFQNKFTVRLTPCSAKHFAYVPTNKNYVFVGQEHQAKGYQRVKISNNLEKPTREFYMNLKCCKETSLINLIFISLIQSTDFTTNFPTMLLKSKILTSQGIQGFGKEKRSMRSLNSLRIQGLKAAHTEYTLSFPLSTASFSYPYIPLKNLSIRSLRSLYKKNQSIFSTNLPKPIRIQDYINKLYLLITSNIWADKSKIYKSKVKDNLKFQLQNRLSKTLSSKKGKQMDTQLKQETNKNRLFWASISDRNLDQTSNKNEGLPFHPLLDSLAEVFDNPPEQGVKGYEILMSNLAKNDKTNLKQKLFTSFPLLLFLLCKTKSCAQKERGDVRPIIKKEGYFAPARHGYEGLLPPIKDPLLKQIFVSKSEKEEGGREKSNMRSFYPKRSKGFVKEKSNMRSFYPKRSKGFVKEKRSKRSFYPFASLRIKASHTSFLFSEALYPFAAHKSLRVFDSEIPSKGYEVEVDSDINENHNQKINPIEYSLQNYQRSNQETCLAQRPTVLEGEWVQQGDLLADCTSSVSGDLSLGKNILVAYMPWEGYNFEDAILISERLVYDDIYTSLHIERYEVEIRDTKFGVEQICSQIPDIPIWELSHLDEKGIAKVGCWVKEGDILIGKVTPIKKKSLSPHEKLLYDIVGKKIPTTRNTSLRLPKGVEGRVISVEILETENIPPGISFAGPGRVHVFIAEKRKIQVGDKISGRHGNKGIVSKIIPQQDMPYLPNGTPVDMVLNPLGVPSRMNVGQVFEALLGLAGVYLNQSFKIPSFDETYGPEASRSIVYSKLYEARLKSGQKWLFDPNFPGKTRVFDGAHGAML